MNQRNLENSTKNAIIITNDHMNHFIDGLYSALKLNRNVEITIDITNSNFNSQSSKNEYQENMRNAILRTNVINNIPNEISHAVNVFDIGFHCGIE